jgi:hypothetical protein
MTHGRFRRSSVDLSGGRHQFLKSNVINARSDYWE